MGGSGPHILLSRHGHIRTNPQSTLANLSFALLHTTSHDQLFYFSLMFSYGFQYSMLFMSMSNLVLIDMNFVDIKIEVLIYFFISMLMDWEKE
jgi:hypothetical protein